MTRQDVMQREYYFTRRTRGLLWLEFLLGGAGFALLLGYSSLSLLALVLALVGLAVNAWRNVQRFRLMDEYEQLTTLKGVGVAFILLMSLVFMGGMALYFLPLAADPHAVGMALLLTFLLAHIVLAVTQSRLAKTGEPV